MEQEKARLKRTTLYIDPKYFKQLKAKLALKGISISKWLMAKIWEELGE